MRTIHWLMLLRVVNIILVVMFHVQLIDMSTGQNHSFCRYISEPFTPIRMPLFIFLSGGLLYLSRIQKGIQTRELYKDKLQRIMIPFVFFVNLYFIIKALLNNYVKTPINFSLDYYLESYIIYGNHPSAHLWFLPTLMTLMLFYPLYRQSCSKVWIMVITAFFSIALFFCDTRLLYPYNYFNIVNLNKYFVYFFLGIVFFKYSVYKYLGGAWVSIILSIMYSILYVANTPLLTSTCGILSTVSLAMLVSKRLSIKLSFISNRIYQIYLMSFIFQPFVELVLWKKIFYNEQFFLFFYILNVTCGIFGPILVSIAAEHSPYKIVRMCFGIKPQANTSVFHNNS